MNNFFKSLFVAPLFLFSALTAYAYVDKTVALITVMDKAAGKTQNYEIPVGTELDAGKLKITVQSCKQTDPFQAEDSFAFIRVQNENHKVIFSSWMSRNNPGAHPLQNPDYDLWVIECK
ncbi:MAG: DUF2155 domain-containing protein [Proteobacteria bacterium]|nr:DUF2155 domain-containing protein [Candidatus Enterousia scatequi]